MIKTFPYNEKVKNRFAPFLPFALSSEQRIFRERLRYLSIEREAEAIAKEYGATLEQVASPLRYKHVARARRALMSLVREKFDWSFPAIGQLFNRDHTTVILAIRKHTYQS
jgi:chromosomal replication initiation ATPase DnaA